MHTHSLDAVEMRQGRIRKVEGILGALKEVDYKKALAMCCYDLGVSSDKIREYFNVLKDSGRIKIKDGVISVTPVKKVRSG